MNFDKPLYVQMAEAIGELDQARQSVGALRRLVAEGKEGASALTAAEWVLAQCIRRCDKLRSQADYAEPLDAA